MHQLIVRRAVAVWIVLAISSFSFAGSSAPQVKTRLGTVEGKDDGKVKVFLGIPYAAPPVGDLRWKAPAPVAKWTGVKKATEFGSHCLQGNVFGDMVFHDPGGSEDCLTLNVWVPDKHVDPKLPVMVWIYGGGFVAGTTSEGRQNGYNLAQQGVIVVSMNYRLGVFGFLVHPELAAESGHNSAGNYGLLDQLAALQWVHDNIAAFGGDPGNVTIFGESAGSFSVSAQMASPLAKGLFQKAIGESGAAFSHSGLSFDAMSARAEKDAKLVKEKLGASTLAELRAIPAEKLLASFVPPQSRGFDFGPDVDGYFLEYDDARSGDFSPRAAATGVHFVRTVCRNQASHTLSPLPWMPTRFIPSSQSPVPISGRPWTPTPRLRSSARAQCSKSVPCSAEMLGSK